MRPLWWRHSKGRTEFARRPLAAPSGCAIIPGGQSPATPHAHQVRRYRLSFRSASMPASNAASAPALPARKPREDEIDAYGVTHPGKVRKDNQDHFLLCSLRKQVVVRSSEHPGRRRAPGRDRAAGLAGHGGRRRGRRRPRARRRAAWRSQAVTQYVARSMRCYYSAARAGRRGVLTTRCGKAPTQCHAELVRRGEEDAGLSRHGHDAHTLPQRVAPGLPAAGGRQPLLPTPERRADPDHPRSDDGAGDGGPRHHEAGATPPAPGSAHTLTSSIGGTSDRSRRSPAST